MRGCQRKIIYDNNDLLVDNCLWITVCGLLSVDNCLWIAVCGYLIVDISVPLATCGYLCVSGSLVCVKLLIEVFDF